MMHACAITPPPVELLTQRERAAATRCAEHSLNARVRFTTAVHGGSKRGVLPTSSVDLDGRRAHTPFASIWTPRACYRFSFSPLPLLPHSSLPHCYAYLSLCA